MDANSDLLQDRARMAQNCAVCVWRGMAEEINLRLGPPASRRYPILLEEGNPMSTAFKRILCTLTIGSVVLAVLPREAGATQWITTCQGVGCFGGSPGCYWYQAPDIQNIALCYGSRP